MKKTWILYLCILSAFSNCFSQKNLPVKEIHVYKSVRMAGNIAVDERGKRISPSQFVSYLLFAEAINGVQWDTAWIKGVAYAISPAEAGVAEAPIEVGTQKLNHAKIRLTPAKGYDIWRLELNPADSHLSTKHYSDTIIYVNYKYKGKVITKKVTGITELYEPPAP